MSDVVFAKPVFRLFGYREHPAVATGMHAAFFKIIAYGVALARAGPTQGIVATAGIRNDSQQRAVLRRSQHRAGGQIDIPLLSDGVSNAVAFRRIISRLK